MLDCESRQYPHDLLSVRRQQKHFTLDDFDVGKRPIGQGKFGVCISPTNGWLMDGSHIAVRQDLIGWAPAVLLLLPLLSGTVLRVREKQSRRILVMKAISKHAILEENVRPQLQREIEVHCRLTHPNIVRMYAYFTDEDKGARRRGIR